ncbi:hypothetical protein M8818_004007 [Zalaria obscura]|uniref:Uncharacterized protein n=1 Tax=Zalaria obscura TaxID=2024903 RepID=A0ACC3SE84_9PEZI
MATLSLGGTLLASSINIDETAGSTIEGAAELRGLGEYRNGAKRGAYNDGIDVGQGGRANTLDNLAVLVERTFIARINKANAYYDAIADLKP